MPEHPSPAGMDPLPCPFCGADAIRVVRGHAHLWRQAQCLSCGATAGEARVFLTHPDGPQAGEVEAMRQAIRRWNTRPDPTPSA